jgi:site-specific recombinase XerC
MSTLSHENAKNEEEIYFNFINSIKSEVTKRIYEKHVKEFMKYCNVNKLSDLLTIHAQKIIVKYVMSMREKGLAYNSVSLSLNAIYHFYEMNDVVLNKKKINMFKGEFKRTVDRAYSHDEIKKLLDFYRYKARPR